ncbi:MAG: malonyl-CoA decarboxylase family protein, partial [Ramlibacter sp.]|nr:malonyl-CoA decarboxylase family protein [Ramlibacter sp.]
SEITKATTAIFYSISNTQPGLRGVSFGDSLIKHVVETLKAEFPKLKTFATLSPIPGFRSWLAKHAAEMLAQTPAKMLREIKAALGTAPDADAVLSALDKPLELQPKSPLRQWLLASAATYIGKEQIDAKPLDAVARFHLGNGARVGRLDWAGDPSPKGIKQSYGLMVNYLYDLKRLDKHRAMAAQGQIPISGAIEDLYF